MLDLVPEVKLTLLWRSDHYALIAEVGRLMMSRHSDSLPDLLREMADELQEHPDLDGLFDPDA